MRKWEIHVDIWIWGAVLLLACISGIWGVVVGEKRRLLVNRFAFPVGYWCAAAMVLGPFVFVMYALVRRKVVRMLVNSAWVASGPEDAPMKERLHRLSRLADAHLLSPQIFSICVKQTSAQQHRCALTQARE
ncbi:hypothetical protein [Pandoraea sp. NPDC087047]|uniref:hypothetical protein n=1 Tax=Pandoraea sp. NPDC087047 TaxID=3364390 RepID=UPI0037F6527E